jgi:hypothetical protein
MYNTNRTHLNPGQLNLLHITLRLGLPENIHTVFWRIFYNTSHTSRYSRLLWLSFIHSIFGMYLQLPMKSDVFTTPHEEWCIHNSPWRVIYLQHPMKSDVFTTPHDEWCIYNSPWRVIHHSSWGVVNISLFMGSCEYITLHGVL